MEIAEAGSEKLAEFHERRFDPEYALAFNAWKTLDPINNPSAPPGPVHMPQYKNAEVEVSARLSQKAAEQFQSAVSIRDIADRYVHITVRLATVLLLTALGQRFRVMGPRIAILAIAPALLVFSAYPLVLYPRTWHECRCPNCIR